MAHQVKVSAGNRPWLLVCLKEQRPVEREAERGRPRSDLGGPERWTLTLSILVRIQILLIAEHARAMVTTKLRASHFLLNGAARVRCN